MASFITLTHILESKKGSSSFYFSFKKKTSFFNERLKYKVRLFNINFVIKA